MARLILALFFAHGDSLDPTPLSVTPNRKNRKFSAVWTLTVYFWPSGLVKVNDGI
jgi:hypothetical protein